MHDQPSGSGLSMPKVARQVHFDLQPVFIPAPSCNIDLCGNVGGRGDTPHLVPSDHADMRLHVAEGCTDTLRFDRQQLLQLQSRSGAEFTRTYLHEVNASQFLSDLVSSQHILLYPPAHAAAQYLDRYMQCKNTAPSSTSAVLLLPARLNKTHSKAIKHMQLLRIYPKGVSLMLDKHNKPAKPLQQPVYAYLDAPLQLKAGKLNDSADGVVLAGHSGSCLHFTASISNAKAKLKIDSGASHEFLGVDFVHKNGLAVTPLARTVALANGSQVLTKGTCTARLNMDKFIDVVTFYVLKLDAEYDAILGEGWLRSRNAVLDFQKGTLTVKSGTKTHTSITPEAHAKAQKQADRSVESLSLSALQMKRLARKPDTQLFLVQITPFTETAAAAKESESPALPQVDGLMPQQELDSILLEFKDIFEEMPGGVIERTGIPPMRVDTEVGKAPPVGVQYRLSQPEYEECQRVVKEGLEKGLIEASTSPFGAPVLFAKKKGGSLRFCCDYRQLNKITVKNRFPLPRIDDCIDRLKHARIFTGIDLQSGYHQLPIAEEHRHKTAFRTPFGLYQWRVVPFGLSNAPSHFAKAMTDLFGDMIGKSIMVYLDDILVFSRTPEEHAHTLRTVLQRLRDNKLYVRQHKCHFNLPEVEFLGHIVGRDGIKVDPRKVHIIKDWPTPKSKKELQSFLGLANYFRRFIHAHSSICRPLHALTGENVKWHTGIWTGECQRAFDLLKAKLSSAPVLTMPDYTKDAPEFEVVADASNFAVGAILLQGGRPIAFESRRLTPAERNYDTTEREMVAVIHALTVWRCYLDAAPLTIFSDHQPLKYLSTKPSLTPRQIRWSQFMEQFNYKWEYRVGRLNAADPLSRAQHGPVEGTGTHNITGYQPDLKLAAAALTDYPPPPFTAEEKQASWLDKIKHLQQRHTAGQVAKVTAKTHSWSSCKRKSSSP